MKWFILAIVMQGSLQSVSVNGISFNSETECKKFVMDRQIEIRDDILLMYPNHTGSTVLCVDKETLHKLTNTRGV